jgi:hypothetical protein
LAQPEVNFQVKEEGVVMPGAQASRSRSSAKKDIAGMKSATKANNVKKVADRLTATKKLNSAASKIKRGR